MRLTKPMVRVFSEIIHNKKTIGEIAEAFKKSPNWVSEIISQLEQEKFVVKKNEFHTKGSRIAIQVSDTAYAVKLRDLMYQYNTIDFSGIISGARLKIIACACFDWKDFKTISSQTGISALTIKSYMQSLLKRGVLEKKEGMLRINAIAWPILSEFLREYRNFSHVHGAIKWKFGDEMLFEITDQQLRQGVYTGFAAYERFWVKVYVIHALCFIPEKTFTKEEVFIHSLYEINDSRTLYLSLVFFIKNKISRNKAKKIAIWYDLYTKFFEFMDILDSKEKEIKPDSLPFFERKDFNRVALTYGVKNVQ